jgi:hypothetical protein
MSNSFFTCAGSSKFKDNKQKLEHLVCEIQVLKCVRVIFSVPHFSFFIISQNDFPYFWFTASLTSTQPGQSPSHTQQKTLPLPPYVCRLSVLYPSPKKE